VFVRTKNITAEPNQRNFIANLFVFCVFQVISETSERMTLVNG